MYSRESISLFRSLYHIQKYKKKLSLSRRKNERRQKWEPLENEHSTFKRFRRAVIVFVKQRKQMPSSSLFDEWRWREKMWNKQAHRQVPERFRPCIPVRRRRMPTQCVKSNVFVVFEWMDACICISSCTDFLNNKPDQSCSNVIYRHFECPFIDCFVRFQMRNATRIPMYQCN